jgi:transglutaminase-like putative cysteine protease
VAPPHRNPPLLVDEDQPRHWLGGSRLLDLEDPRLRLRVRALTQLFTDERGKALALYGFVKRLPLARRFRLRLSTARQVIDAGRGDANDKATLLVAMLRASGIPARIRYLQIDGEILRGLTAKVSKPIRPVVEAWLHGRWLRTDTYIFDAAYMAAARQRLKDDGWERGYGIHVGGAMVWDGYDSAYVGGMPTTEDPMVLGDLGVYHDPQDFVASPAYLQRHRPLVRLLHWNLLVPSMQRGIRRLREGRMPPGGVPRQRSS